MAKYMLKRNYFTPWGSFRKTEGGVEIGDHVVEKYGVPKDAVLVDGSYVPEDDARRLLPHEAAKKSNQERLSAAAGERVAEIITHRTEFQEAGGHLPPSSPEPAPEPELPPIDNDEPAEDETEPPAPLPAAPVSAKRKRATKKK